MRHVVQAWALAPSIERKDVDRHHRQAMVETIRGGLSGGRRSRGNPSDQGMLREEDFLRLRLRTDGSEVGQLRMKGQRVVDGLMIQMADGAGGLGSVFVRVPHGANRRRKDHGQNRERDQSEPNWLVVEHLSSGDPGANALNLH